ncbi:MAG: tetratricopeptide repeat protein, partial [Coriobacteriia bacterium]|nr:tetratricopeptide repeat protein [Coriobacteriia bacterium]
AATSPAAAGDASAYADAERAMVAARTRLPHDTLVVAQLGDVYLAAGIAQRDPALLERALPIIERSVGLDPENGYRWAARGSALAGLGRIDEAITSLTTAVRYAPNDAQAWATLAQVYETAGEAAMAQNARVHAEEIERGTR